MQLRHMNHTVCKNGIQRLYSTGCRLQLYKYIHNCENEKDCCELEIESNRFQWCEDYFCFD